MTGDYMVRLTTKYEGTADLRSDETTMHMSP